MSQYAQNIYPIDGTDVSQCVTALGRKFKFTLDANIGAVTTLEHNNNSIISKYLYPVTNNSALSTSVLQVLIG